MKISRDNLKRKEKKRKLTTPFKQFSFAASHDAGYDKENIQMFSLVVHT